MQRKYLQVYSIKAIKCKCCHPVQRITICSWNLFFINTKNTKELAASGPEGSGLMKQPVLSESRECTMAVYLLQPNPLWQAGDDAANLAAAEMLISWQWYLASFLSEMEDRWWIQKLDKPRGK